MESTNDRPYRQLRVRANDPGTSVAERRSLLPGLGWRDLLFMTSQHALPPVSRRQAEAQLVTCIRSLTVGEAISLARICPVAAMPPLYKHADKRVLNALLGNPRLLEPMVLAWIQQDDSRNVLRLIAGHPSWKNKLPACEAQRKIDTLSSGEGIPATDCSEP